VVGNCRKDGLPCEPTQLEAQRVKGTLNYGLRWSWSYRFEVVLALRVEMALELLAGMVLKLRVEMVLELLVAMGAGATSSCILATCRC
jgi:hypothetical protein